MKQVTLKIPDKKLDFFMELIKQLGFEITDEEDISEKQKTIVRERMSTSKPEEMVPWDETRGQFSFKGKS